MENWQIAMINETRRRQDQIAEADMYRLSQQAETKKPGWKRIYQNLLLQLADLLIEVGTRLQCRYTELSTHSVPGTEISPCS
jgi:hypothetical protein